jgi:hypothetical protein
MGDWIFSSSHMPSWNGSGNKPGLAALVETACCKRQREFTAIRISLALHDHSGMPLVKSVKTDGSGRFDSGDLQEGHYTLVIDWQSEYAERFNVEIKKLPRPTTSVKIDLSPVYPDCTGGHEFISLQE